MSSWRRMLWLAVLVGLAWLAVPGRAIASEYHGQVTFGGLPVPGSTVTVTATQGDKKAVAITDDQGVFAFADLTDGVWTLTIEMTGFAPVKQDVTVAPNAPAGSFALKLLTLAQIRAADNPVTEANTPEAASPQASEAKPGASTAAAAGAKGAAKKSAGSTAAAGGAPGAPAPQEAEASAPQSSDGFLINGSVNNAATSQYSLAQAFGNTRNSRSLYNYGLVLVLDNSALDAEPYSLSGVNTGKPAYNDFTAGVTFGGPLKIPHLLPAARAPYFGVIYQRTQRNTDTTQSALVPTLAERYGDLSAVTTTVYDPATGKPYGNTNCSPQLAAVDAAPTVCIPQAELATPASLVSQALLGYYPLPNLTGSALYNYQVPLVSSMKQDVYQLQLQKQLGNKNNLNGRFNAQSNRSSNASLFGFTDTSDTLGMNANANWYHRFTQRLSMTAGYNFSRNRSEAAPWFENRENVSGNAGISGNDQDPTYWGPPSLGFSSTIVGLSDGNFSYDRQETNSVTYYMDWNKFRHNVRVGGDFRRQEFNYLTQSNPRGSLSFTGTQTSNGITGAGSDVADFLLGLPDTALIAYGNADKYLRQSVYDLYANDDFRVNPELSINYGVRWEYGAPITELKNRLVNLDVGPGFATETPVLASNPIGAASGMHYPTSLIRPDKIDVWPRIGIAWRPISGSSLLINMGYGVYDDTSVYQATAYAMAQQAPLSTSLNIPNSPGCAFTIANPFTALPCASTVPDTFAVDPNFRVGYAQVWTLSARRDLPGSLQAMVTYLGTKGTRGVQEILPNTYPIGAANPCPSCASGYLYRDSYGDSTREEGDVQLRRRLRAGFTANLLYKYSKSLDDDFALGGQGQVASSGGSPQVAQDWTHPNSQRGLSTFDQRHNLAVSVQYTTGMGLGGRTLVSGWRGTAYKEWTFLANFGVGSGLPETPMYPFATPGATCTECIRPSLTGQAVHGSPAPGVFLNPGAFTAPAAGQWGDARRDSITGPDTFSLNASMDRTFRLHDRYNLEARIDTTNVLNHVVYSGWNTMWIPNNGNLQYGAPSGVNGMRSAQITLRLRY